jgi:hypothetical protein
MTAIIVHLPQETARILSDRAALGGQTLDAYLADLAEQAARAPAAPPAASLPEDDDSPRPWRGVFAPEVPREKLFTCGTFWRPEDLPKQEAAFDMSWHRTVEDDE